MKTQQIIFLLIVIVLTSCVKNKRGTYENNQNSSVEKVFVIKEVVQTTSYTYLKVDENSTERWVAVTRMDAKSGEKYYYDEALLMNNFHSKELDRDFETIYFINKVSSVPFSMQEKMKSMPASHSSKTKAIKRSSITLEKSSEELSVAHIFENAEKLADTEVEIRGVVVKVNKEIMGKNWVHIQDGTSHNDSYDLTITTQDLPSKDDEVTFKGKITLNKDFGAGYVYDLIMEDAEMKK